MIDYEAAAGRLGDYKRLVLLGADDGQDRIAEVKAIIEAALGGEPRYVNRTLDNNEFLGVFVQFWPLDDTKENQ